MPSMMGSDHDGNESGGGEKQGSLNGTPDASTTDTPSTGEVSAKNECPERNDLPDSDAHPEPETLKAETASGVAACPSEIQTTTSKAELAVPVEKAPAVSEVSSVAAAASDAAKGDAKARTRKETPNKTQTADNKKFVILTHYGGEKFMLPWAGMEDLIRSSYRDNEKAKEFDKGKYKLYTKEDRLLISRQCWDLLVQPGWDIVLQLESQSSSNRDLSSDSDDDCNPDQVKPGDQEVRFTEEVKYTIDYYAKKKYSFDEDRFLYSVSYDNPVALKTSDNKAQTLPVLEEKKNVVCPKGSSSLKKPSSKGGPKLDAMDLVGETLLYVHSSFLLNVLRSIIKYSSSKPSEKRIDQLRNGAFLYPYHDLFYHKQELSDYKKKTTGPRANHTPEYNAECDRHIDLLIEYLDQEPTVQLKTLEAKWAQKVPTTTFAGFHLLMKPGSDVYVREDGQLNAYVVHSVDGGVKRYFHDQWFTTAESYSVRVWNLVYDGKVIKRRSKMIHVPMFDNDRDIMSLPLFPIRFQDNMDGGVRRQKLIERGKEVFRFAKDPAFLEYTGLGLKPGWKRYNRARVVIEHESQPWSRSQFNSMYWDLSEQEQGIGKCKGEDDLSERARAPRCECSRCIDFNAMKGVYRSVAFGDYDNIDPKETKGLSEHQYLLCMSHMFGFILKDRTYDLLDVSGLSNPKLAEDAIDRLVMRPEENKETIKAIAKTYADGGQAELFSADFIHGKGEGQIFLLHGPPGTGKTLTAESVAEYTKRPLLSITAADLGHEPTELEKNLLRFFRDANNWDAIVLLDEADIYLERRSINDLRRNSIVSIFLRALDYFQGILFLTTNRVGKFDEAFMSRIHVSIGYERLDSRAREQIWENLFRKLKEDHKNGGPEIRYEYEAKQYVKKSPDVKKLQWNGREIRNAFQTAVALAYFDARMAKEKGGSDEDLIPEVKERHLAQVVSMSTAFKEYITSTHEGVEDADLAYRLGNRDDNFGTRAATECGD
ncbi:hypothetical protein FQN50_004433 [Emmonsiellopsis sp. PD_5]|nr:hypothetical protein FQN50_004433 [Emmonsiellopsis sp. PD_5]